MSSRLTWVTCGTPFNFKEVERGLGMEHGGGGLLSGLDSCLQPQEVGADSG